jgi:tRNA (guanine-N7-)-methyltransferase
VNADISFFSDFFANSEIGRIYINFCDPWPSNRHKKRRLTSPRFLQMYKDALCPKGQIRFKTDNLPLFEYSLMEFEGCGFSILEETRDLHKDGPIGVMTDYERKFYGMGLPIYAAICEKQRVFSQSTTGLPELYL